MKKKTAGRFAFILALLMLFAALPFDRNTAGTLLPQADAKGEVHELDFDVTYSQTEARRMLDMINDLRRPENAWAYNENNEKVYNTRLSPLTYDYRLEEIAMQRAAELYLKWDHVRPTGEPFYTAYGDGWTAMGENIGMFSSYDLDAETPFEAWCETDMPYADQGHRRNMLNAAYTAVGICIIRWEGASYAVQEFGAPNSGAPYREPFDGPTTVRIAFTTDMTGGYLVPDTTSYSVPLNESVPLPDWEIWISVFRGRVDDYAFTVADPSIARIDGDKITGLRVGKTELTLTVLGRTKTISLTVYDAAVREPLCEHLNVRDVPRQAPTCWSRGFEAGVYCEDCKTYIRGREKIPATDAHTVERLTEADYTYCRCRVCGKFFTDTSGEQQVSAAAVMTALTERRSAVTDRGWDPEKKYQWTFYGDGTLLVARQIKNDAGAEEQPYDKHRDETKTVIVDDSIKILARSMFSHFKALETAWLGVYMEEIMPDAFGYCEKLKTINFPDSLRRINNPDMFTPDGAFTCCSSLERAHLNEGLYIIGGQAFAGSGIRELYLPDSLYWVNEYHNIGAFQECVNLKAVYIPARLTRIAPFMFYCCDALSEIRFEDAGTLTQICGSAFTGTAYFDDPMNRRNDILYLDSNLIHAGHFEENEYGQIETVFQPDSNCVRIPEGVRLIADNAFGGCTDLVRIDLPDSLRIIGELAFCCKKLRSVSFGNTETILDSAFYDCDDLPHVDLPETLTSLGAFAFCDCDALEEIRLPDRLLFIGGGAFYRCSRLASIEFGDLNFADLLLENFVFDDTAWYDAQPEGMLFIGNVCMGYKGELPEGAAVRIPDGTVYLAGESFYRQKLREIVLPDSVLGFGRRAFAKCPLLKKAVLPRNLKRITAYAFQYCRELEEINIPRSAEVLGDRAFFACSKLENLDFPETLSIETALALSMTKWCAQQPSGSVVVNGQLICYKTWLPINYQVPDGTRRLTRDCMTSGLDNETGEMYGTLDSYQLKRIYIPASLEVIDEWVFDQQNTDTFRDVYYEGDETAWNAIRIEGVENWVLDFVTVHYNHRHAWNPDSERIMLEPSCTEPGTANGMCECGLEMTREIPKNGHRLTYRAAVPAACNVMGIKEYYHCEDCGKNFADADGTEEIAELYVPAAGHRLTYTPEKPATCLEAGNPAYYTCTVCGRHFSDADGKRETTYLTIPITGHSPQKTEAKAAGCTEAGNVEYYTCTVCGRIFADQSCTEEIAETAVPAAGHSFGAWETVREATFTEEGVEQRTCSRCQAEETRPIPKAARNYTPGDVDGNGEISAADARLALRRSVGLETYEPGSPAFLACDVLRDGNVTAADARLILRASVGLEDPATWI